MNDSRPSKPIEDRGEASLVHLRENAEPTTTGGRLTWWTAVICGLFAAGGFSYLGRRVGSLDNHQFIEPNYVAVGPGGGAGEGVEKTPLEELMALGERHFNTCAGCHGASGAGGSGIPPLDQSEWVSGPTQRLGMIVMHGVSGPITVRGVGYSNSMAPQGASMSPKDLAAIMTYVRVRFGSPDLIDPQHLVVSEEVAAAIQAVEHSGQMTAAELDAKHSVYTEGQLLDPATGEPAS